MELYLIMIVDVIGPLSLSLTRFRKIRFINSIIASFTYVITNIAHGG